MLLAISLFACTSNKEKGEVFVFNNISFKLIEGERVVNTDYLIAENYQSYFKSSNIQNPLFRCIKNQDYTIYLSIPYNTSIDTLMKFQILGQTAGLTELQTDTITYFFKRQNNDTTYISEYSTVIDKNIIYLLTTTNSKKVSDSLFNQTDLSNRFIQK